MYLDNLNDITNIAKQVNFSIFELPSSADFSKIFEKSYHIKPNEKNSIQIEDIRDITQLTTNKQNKAFFVVVEQAEKLTNSAANAFLKSLEEPTENIHYIFLTTKFNLILPTVKSRANNYFLKDDQSVNSAPKADVDVFSLAKEYISATPKDLPAIVDKILKYNKDDTRSTALSVLSCSIEMMYKSYLLRGNQSFLTKIEKLLATEDAINKNGHVKLQLIANML